MAGHFTVDSVRKWEPAISKIISERLDEMEAAGPLVDLVDAFALPASSFTICEILGTRHADRQQFERPAAISASASASLEEKESALRKFVAYGRTSSIKSARAE